ncbi:hypothetical protein F5X68DRAFT_265064 [Plectosphaerella plurivora]|uniref:DUF4604 domain-containing protein n=1 Tax=Plectosphaerella plurivora TaxID=936078 RepID=A0A9P8V3C4_9PEZI|nr:hypothetical protein F5X68DRAFT_265064 [Plectosphaerella plurivora]
MPSPKISAKQLSYSSDLPPFLRALHAQAGGGSSAGPDPILAGRRRAAKKRSDSEEAEDQPLVVDEDGNVVQLNPDGSAPDAADAADTETSKTTNLEEGETRTKEKLAGIGAGRKRKVGKVVGDEGGAAEDKDKPESGGPGKTSEETSTKPAGSEKPKKKKTAKKIKLSFDPE